MDNADNNNSDRLVPNGVLLIIGNAKDKIPGAAILRDFTDLLDNQARIEVIMPAYTEAIFNGYEQTFREAGAAHVGHIAIDERPSDDLLARLKNTHAVFFAGPSAKGELNDEIRQLLEERYLNNRLVIAGTNAVALEVFTKGFEGLLDILLDTDCSDNSPFIQMSDRVKKGKAAIGICIEEETACLISGVDINVLGKGVVCVVDGSKAHATTNTAFKSLKIDILSKGQVFKVHPGM